MEAPDFDLPDEVLAVIPTDPYDQLDLARKITSMAIASRVSNLESETACLNQKLHEKDQFILHLQDQASRLQHATQEAESRFKLLLDENMRLVQEKDSLSATVKKLTRDLAKLETFKRQLMQSLNEDTSAETVDIGTCDQSVPTAYTEKVGNSNDYTRHNSHNGSIESSYSSDELVKQTGQRFSLTPYQITPRLTPTGTPKVISTTVSPKSYSAVGSPQNSGATTPTKMQYDGRTSLSAWYPSSQQSSAANSPPRVRALPGRTPRIDGKEFFRQARSRLSYEQFSAFLANIKQLNDHKQSREETLRNAEEILGADNNDLYLSFQGLLSRNVH